MKNRMLLAVFCVGVFLNGICAAAAVREIHFPAGKSSAVIKQAVIRGENDQYFLSAKAGQKMEVKISSLFQSTDNQPAQGETP